jgi:hypothetical protein
VPSSTTFGILLYLSAYHVKKKKKLQAEKAYFPILHAVIDRARI